MKHLSTIVSLFSSLCSLAQTIGTFGSVQPTDQTQNLVLPSTHTFQRILRSGAALSSGETAGNNFDFTGYVPIGGSSTNGYLSISSETVPAGVAILSLSFNSTNKLWTVNSGGNVPFPFASVGVTSAFCAGTVTPNNHIMVCEETMAGSDFNGDGYNDDGWIIELDPVTRTVINQDGVGGPDKLWAMGRQKHEDVAIKQDLSVAYWSADNDTAGYVYKFVPATPGNFSSGALYVLQCTSSLGTGTWQLVPNTTVAERNNTPFASKNAGGFNFVRIEGIELGPDNKVYFAATVSGRVYRFRDLGPTVDQLEVFIESTSYDVDGAGPYAPEPWGSGADNLAFDGEGNLWVLQDGGRNHIWVVGPNHTAATPNVRLFATTPAGSEPTGITFSPDYKFLFMSIQHPNGSNTATQPDAAGQSVIFDNSTAIVIARKENLGTNTPLPLNLLSFDARQSGNTVDLRWKTASVVNEEFEVERSMDGVQFSVLGSKKAPAASFQFVDDKLPSVATLYYRLRQRNASGRVEYSETKTVRLQNQSHLLRLYPSPATDKLRLDFTSSIQPANISILNSAGAEVKRINNLSGNSYEVDIRNLPAGSYRLVVQNEKEKSVATFVKQ